MYPNMCSIVHLPKVCRLSKSHRYIDSPAHSSPNPQRWFTIFQGHINGSTAKFINTEVSSPGV